MFLSAMWSSLCSRAWYMYRFISPFGCSVTWFKCSCWCASLLNVSLFGLFKTMVSILHVLLVFLKYSVSLKFQAQLIHVWKCKTFVAWYKLLIVCSEGLKNVWFLLAITANDNLCTFCRFIQNYKVQAYVISMEFSAVNCGGPSRETSLLLGVKKDGCFCRLDHTEGSLTLTKKRTKMNHESWKSKFYFPNHKNKQVTFSF